MKTFIRRYSVLVPILVILTLLVRSDFFSWSIYVIVGQIAAVAVALSARLAFRKQELRAVADPGSGALIQHGPYRFIRHPMYTGVMLLIWIAIAGHWSVFNAALGLVVAGVIMVRMHMEEEILRAHYPEYAEYTHRTKRMIPFVF